MNGKIPILCESLEYFKNWSIYENDLNKFNKVKFYYGDLFKLWVTENKNPLEIPIILDLFKNKLDENEKRLENIELLMGQENLLSYFNELKGQSKPEQIIQKINSLDYETFVYIELKKKYKQINKINITGDWESDDKIVSVKSILDLDFNYQLISNLINSMFYIREYQIIRKYESVRLSNGKGINYYFRNIVLDYLRKNLINVLNKFDKIDSRCPYLEEFDNIYSENLKISIYSCLNNNSKEIRLYFEYENSSNSTINIEFKSGEFSNAFYGLNYDSNDFFIDEKNSNEEKIINKISKVINEFDKNLNKTKKSFEGWIILSMHPKDEEYFLKNENKFIEKIIKIRKNENYKIVLNIIPQWNFQNEEVKKFEI